MQRFGKIRQHIGQDKARANGKRPAARISIRSTYPCCKGAARFDATVGTERETYTKHCPRCGRTWDVVRRSVRAAGSLRIDALDWEG